MAWRYAKDPKEIKNIWEKQISLQNKRNKNLEKPVFIPVLGGYNDKFARPSLWFEIPRKIDGEDTYDWAWKVALKQNPDYILITSWNEFFEGTAIEPSVEYGDYYLNKTQEWVSKWNDQLQSKTIVQKMN